MLLLILLVVLAAGLLCVAYGVFIERGWFRLVRYRVDILPAGGPEALRVLHLSDLHLVRDDNRKARFLASLPQADVTVVTGDIIGEPEAVERSVEALRPVRGRFASYFVLGSNDYYVPRPLNYLGYFWGKRKQRRGTKGRAPELVAQLEADGWTHLENIRTEVALDGLTVELLGLDDPHIGRHDMRVAPRRSPERFGFAVVHSPDPAPELAALGYDLVVAGHTHGGQVRMPLVGALVNNSQLPRRLSAGLIRMGPTYLHVSQGLGTSKYAPFRFLCRPEATLLELGRAGPE
ncbi:MAG: metallophosphoesterase family protein [Actinobacteria bacterium]|nr:metallophosphoesterase family protein [Actinomycetota bacterium]